MIQNQIRELRIRNHLIVGNVDDAEKLIDQIEDRVEKARMDQHLDKWKETYKDVPHGQWKG